MKTVYYGGVKYRVVEDRGDSVLIGPMGARTPRQVVMKIELDAGPPAKKKVAKKKAAKKKKATKKRR